MNTSVRGSQQRISRLANAGSMFALACSLAASAIAGEVPVLERIDAERHVILHDCGDRLFDLVALSGGLGLRVSRTEGEVVVQSPDGREWRGAVGSPGLLTADGYRVLSHALVEQGGALFVDRHAIEEFTWRALKEAAADDEASDAALTAARPNDTSAEPLLSAASPTPAELGTPAQIAAAPIGWQSFELQKSPEELSEYERIYGPGKAKMSGMARYVNLPPQHETLNLQVGQGYVQGLDAGTDVQGSGSFAGYRANFNSQMTMGSQGFIMQTGRFSVTSPDGRWTADAGDMSSDIWGWARGARFTWNGNPKHAPTASFYAKTEPTGGFRNVFAVSDYFRLNRSVVLGGELGSDGSAIVRPSFRFSRLSLSPYYRVTSDRGDSQGVYGSVRLAERVSLFGAYTKSLFEGDERVRLNAGVQVPLPRRASVRLERTKMESHYSRMALSSATVTVPVGKIRLFGRMQLRSNESLSRTGPASWRRTDQSEFFGGASYFAGSRLNISYQTANRWRPDGSIHQWQQLVGSLKINRSTFLNAITVLPDDTTPSQSRIRLTRRITDDWSAILEYGNLPPYQGEAYVEPEDSRFRIMIQKQFQIKTPALGATVGGTVADLIGNPLEGALVRLGSHAAVTNKEGRYRLLFVPPGDYTISLDESRLSAEYSAIDPPKQIETTLGSSHTVDWTVAPLNTIFGLVCEDANSDGDCGPDEGLKGIPVFLGAKVTATRDDGVFVFYNLLPGPYSVRLKEDRLPKGYVLESPLSASVEVKPGEAVLLIRFLLKRKVRPIIFQFLRATENQ